MDEEEFDSLMPRRSFGTDDAMRADAQARRSTALGIALWGKTSDDLHRQLLAPHPEIPSGFDLADFRELQERTRELAERLGDPRQRWLSSAPSIRALSSPIIVIGTQRLTAWEARCEIIRRVIEHLENR
jgi:hypothetical protein